MTTLLHRPICNLLGCSVPIVLAGMGGVARSELVSAVTAAGGFGFLGMVREPVALIRAEVQRLRACNVQRFGVSLIPYATAPDLLDAQVTACIELGVPVISLFWEVQAPLVQRLRDAGIVIVYQVGSVAEAWQAEQAGAHVLIAQGVEAGGHVWGDRPLAMLVPEIVAATSLPILAAGGITTGADVATMLSLGAQGVVLGTALITTQEAFAHPYHKQRLVEASAGDTVLTDRFHINWPRGAKVRVLANSVTRGERGDPFAVTRTVIGDEDGRPIYLFSTDSPLCSMTGDFEAMALYAGTGVDQVTRIDSATERLASIILDAVQQVVSNVAAEKPIEPASPVCLAHEMEGAYMGYATRDELLYSLNELLEAERAGSRVALQTAREALAPELKTLVAAIQRDEARWCGVLTNAIQMLDGKPSRHTGAFHDKAMAIPDIPARLAFLNRGQGWVVRKLQVLLPTIRDDRIRADLSAMLISHEHNIELVATHLPATS